MTELIALISSMAFGLVVNLLSNVVGNRLDPTVGRLLKKLGLLPAERSKTYEERMSSLTANVAKASAEMDRVLREMALVGQEHLSAVKSLERQLGDLRMKEQSLKEQIQALEQTPIPVAEYFAGLVEQGNRQGERRSAWRDYLLFAAGVVVSAVVSIILKQFGI